MPGTWLLFLLVAGACLSGEVRAYDGIVAFGDSLTDNGAGASFFMEVFNTTEVYPPPPYFDGVYSNGPPYINYTAAILGLPLTDYAIGGATTGAVPAVIGQNLGLGESVLIPSLVEQVMSYAEGTAEGISSESLYVLYAGSNDYTEALRAPQPHIGAELVEAVIGNVSTAVSILVDGGATRFVLPNLAPLQSTPSASEAALGPQAKPTQAVLTQLVAAHNAGLVILGAEMAAQGLKVAVFDVNELVQGIILNGAAAFNIKDTTKPCFNSTAMTLCSDPENHLFFDEVHPTAQIHQLFGELLANEIAV